MAKLNIISINFHRYNITCSNIDCKNYKKLIGRAMFEISCPICGRLGDIHSRACNSIKGKSREINCCCEIKNLR